MFQPRRDYFVDHAATNVCNHAATILSTMPRLMFRPRRDYFVDHAAT